LYRSSSGIGIRRYFYERQVGSQLTYLSEFQDLVEQEHDLLVQQSRRRDAEDATLQSPQHSDPVFLPCFTTDGASRSMCRYLPLEPRIRSSMKSTSQA
jgi:hypothetical protein